MPSQPYVVMVEQDHPMVAEIRKAILESHGYSVEVVRDFSDARGICNQEHCELVLIDSRPSQASAIDLCQAIKKIRPTQKIAIMAGYEITLPTDCPDLVIRQDEGPAGFAAKIKTLIGK